MRIDLNSAGAVSESRIEKAGTHAAQTKAGNDTVETSEGNMSIGKLAAQALSSPEVRSEKIQALQSQLGSGAYNVSAAQIAGPMLEQMRVRAS